MVGGPWAGSPARGPNPVGSASGWWS